MLLEGIPPTSLICLGTSCGGLFVVAVLFFCYSLCRVAGDADCHIDFSEYDVIEHPDGDVRQEEV